MDDPRQPDPEAPAALSNPLGVGSRASVFVNWVFLPIVGAIVTGHIFTSVLSHR